MTPSPRRFALLLLVVLAIARGAVSAQSPQQTGAEIAALRKEMEELKATLQLILKDVQETKAILQRVTQPQQGPRPVTDVADVSLSVANAPVRGSRTATVALVEFSDFQCPFCARHHAQTWPQLNQEYIDTGRVQFFFVNFPIAELHPQAFKAHEAAACAGEQASYWEMYDRLFANQRRFAPADLAQHAADIGLDMTKFQPCLDTGRTAELVRADLTRAQQLGFSGTPTFLIGTVEPNGTTVKGLKVITGAQPFAVFKQTLDEMLTLKK
jgi:protein-disulfide isomerase